LLRIVVLALTPIQSFVQVVCRRIASAGLQAGFAGIQITMAYIRNRFSGQ
jgi:hypothetical protein